MIKSKTYIVVITYQDNWAKPNQYNTKYIKITAKRKKTAIDKGITQALKPDNQNHAIGLRSINHVTAFIP